MLMLSQFQKLWREGRSIGHTELADCATHSLEMQKEERKARMRPRSVATAQLGRKPLPPCSRDFPLDLAFSNHEVDSERLNTLFQKRS